MPTSERSYLHLSSGVDYIEYQYLDKNDNPIEKDLSSKVLILECDKEGNVLRTLHGHVKKESAEPKWQKWAQIAFYCFIAYNLIRLAYKYIKW